MTTKVSTFDRATLKAASAELLALVAKWGEEHGVAITLGRGKFSNGSTASVVFELATIGENGVVVNKYRSAWPRFHALFGFELADLDRKFQYGGREYTIVGLNANASKSPIVAKRDDGTTFVFAAKRAAYVWVA